MGRVRSQRHSEVLFAVALDGSVDPFQLARIEGGHISSFQISPDSQYVVYTADPNSYRTWELFSVPLAVPIPEPATLQLLIPALVMLLAYGKLHLRGR